MEEQQGAVRTIQLGKVNWIIINDGNLPILAEEWLHFIVIFPTVLQQVSGVSSSIIKLWDVLKDLVYVMLNREDYGEESIRLCEKLGNEFADLFEKSTGYFIPSLPRLTPLSRIWRSHCNAKHSSYKTFASSFAMVGTTLLFMGFSV